MAGQYVTFVAYGVPKEFIRICNVSINGNRYIRSDAPETNVVIPAGKTHIIEVEHVRAEFPLGNDLAINLR